MNTINYDQGLLNNSIKGVITDEQGFTWISTSSGLQRYNGYTLQPVTPVVEGDTIRIDYAAYFAPGRGRTILIGYRNGILEYNTETNTFKKIIYLAVNKRNADAVMPIVETSEGIWCFEERKGIIIYTLNGGASRPIPTTETAAVNDLIRTEGYDITRKLIAFNNRFIFIRTSPNKILQINIITHESKNLFYPGSSIVGLECNDNKVFVASINGLGFIRIADESISKIFLYKQITDELINRSTIELSGENLLIVSVEKRLFEFDTTCKVKREIISQNLEPLMKTGYIQLVYEDRLRRIWLLTDQDIKRIQNTETPFAHYIYPNQKENFIKCIYYDKEKNILLAGSFDGAIQLYDSIGKPLLLKPFIDYHIKHILSIEKLSENHYLILTEGNGLWMFRLKQKQLTPVDLRNAPFLQSAIKNNSYSNNLQRVNDSTIFISTKSNVFRCIIQKNNVRSASASLEDSSLHGEVVSCFIFTSDKILWVATQSNVRRLNTVNNLHTINIPGNYLVRCMAEDGMHNIWIGTEKGLFIYKTSGILIRHVARESGLLSDFIYALLPADKKCHDFFASTRLGLSYISTDGKIKNYTRELGLQENEFNTQSAAMSPEGQLFFGGVNGISAFYPSALSSVRDTSLINITRLVVNDSAYNSFGGAFKADFLRLAYNQNHLQFDIAAIGLLNPNEYFYKYRLVGFEKSWQTTHQPTGIKYTLQPGKYMLEISCSLTLFSGGVLHKKIVLIIDPPWWETTWFLTASILAGVLIVFFISYYVLKQKYYLKLRKLEIRHQLITERERISRELHDNIGSQLSYISSNLDWLVDSPESFSKAEEFKRLSVVNETAKNLVTDLRETIWAMKKEFIMLDELADKLKSFLQQQSILEPQMEMIITESIKKNYSFSPTEALNVFRICQEAIVNCFRHSQAEKIFFSVQSGNNEDFSFTIQDNGKGFVQQKQYKDHYGLENMEHRAIESKATLLIDSVPGKGTKVTVTKFLDLSNNALLK